MTEHTLDQNALARAWRDSMRFRQSFYFWFLQTVSVITFVIISIVLTPNEWSPLAKTLAPVFAGPVGFLTIVCLTFFWNWTRAPYRQRDEARALLAIAHQKSTAPFEIRFGSMPPYKLSKSYKLGQGDFSLDPELNDIFATIAS